VNPAALGDGIAGRACRSLVYGEWQRLADTVGKLGFSGNHKNAGCLGTSCFELQGGT